jgi:cytokinin dehydrogenase
VPAGPPADRRGVSTIPAVGDLPALDGDLAWDIETREVAADDFGHLVSRLPRGVLRPGSVTDVAAMTRWAGERGWKVATRGQGHSVYGRSQVDDGLVIDMSSLDAVQPVRPDRVAVGAGATWRSVLDATLPHGLTPPVLTNYLDLSVGGTLSVGGIGGTTHRTGAQTDSVLELEVVTGDGRVLRCSPDENPDLFHAVRAGLGQVGIITQAVLGLVPAPDRVRAYTLRYPDLPALGSDQRRALRERRADHLQGSILPDGAGGWAYQLEAAVFTAAGAGPDDRAMLAGLSDIRDAADVQDLSYLEFVTVFDGFVNLLRSTGDWANPHPWLLGFLPGSTAERIAADVLEDLSAADLGTYGRVVFYPIDRGAVATRLLRLPEEPVVFPFNLIRVPSDGDLAREMVSRNRAIYERIRSRGAVLYPVSALSLSTTEWRDHFGAEWPTLHEAADRFDPRRVLNPGQGIFDP